MVASTSYYVLKDGESLGPLVLKRLPIRFVVQPFVFIGRHPVFQIDMKTLGDSIDIVEIADHLDGDGQLMVIKTMLLERLDILSGHRLWPQS